jgi:hypothetical protein
MVCVELGVDMVVPLLQRKGEALFVEKLGIELILRLVGNKDHLEGVSPLGVSRSFGCFTIRNRAHLKEEEEVIGETMLVVSKGSREDVKDSLFVKFKLNLCLVDRLDKNVEARGGRVKSFGIKRVVALGIFILTEVVDCLVHGVGIKERFVHGGRVRVKGWPSGRVKNAIVVGGRTTGFI